jgi:putative hydrolase of the HAD superfamily
VTISAVLFDFGGVFTTSPFEAFNRYENAAGLPTDLIRTINSANPDTNAWAQFERSEVDIDGFVALFNAEGAARGHQVDGHQVLGCLKGDLRPDMVTALGIVKSHFKVGCITNNIASSEEGAVEQAPRHPSAEVMSMFEVVIESSKVGLRKPDPAIYELACRKLGVEPGEAVYLDDLGINCKPAKAMGMATIKVLSGEQAIADLEHVLGISLRS